MDFDFSDDQEMLRDSVRAGSTRAFDFERRHALAKAGGYTREAWRELAELGPDRPGGARGARRHGLRRRSTRWS